MKGGKSLIVRPKRLCDDSKGRFYIDEGHGGPKRPIYEERPSKAYYTGLVQSYYAESSSSSSSSDDESDLYTRMLSKPYESDAEYSNVYKSSSEEDLSGPSNHLKVSKDDQSKAYKELGLYNISSSSSESEYEGVIEVPEWDDRPSRPRETKSMPSQAYLKKAYSKSDDESHYKYRAKSEPPTAAVKKDAMGIPVRVPYPLPVTSKGRNQKALQGIIPLRVPYITR